MTGASGDVGGRLVPELLREGWCAQVMARTASRLRDYPWFSDMETVVADATDPARVAEALAGVDVAYYLVHSIGSAAEFEDTDRGAAQTFARAASDAGVRRIVYLGGLAPKGEERSPHLRSREEVGRILLDSGAPTAVLQAAVVLGSGSARDAAPPHGAPPGDGRAEVGRHADPADRHPGRTALPGRCRRAATGRQPSVRHRRPGRPDLRPHDARVRRRGRVAPAEDAQGAGAVADPVQPLGRAGHTRPGSLARPLVESLRNTVVCREHDIAEFVPDPAEGLIGFEQAVRLALVRIRDADVATHWSNASVAGVPSDPLPTDPDWARGSLYVDERSRPVEAPPEVLWKVIEGIGGETGWYSWGLLWSVRGLVDRLWGGPGLRRGRRSPTDLQIGDALDFWRVEEVVDGELLRLRAEMKVPGRAWLDLGIERDGDGRTMFHQRAVFAPKGLLGRLYWPSVLPFPRVGVRWDAAQHRGESRSCDASIPRGSISRRARWS